MPGARAGVPDLAASEGLSRTSSPADLPTPAAGGRNDIVKGIPVPVIEIANIEDPRLDDYRDIRDRDLRGRRAGKELFVGEQRLVVERMLRRPGVTRSVLISANWRDRIAPLAPADVPVYVTDPATMKQVAGFDVHRGVLANGGE